jgi:hypothetical protein
MGNGFECSWADTGRSLATKTITRQADGSITEEPYGNAKYFSFFRRSYPTLTAFADALWSAAPAKTVFLIRGQLREELHPRATHRRVWKDGDPKRTLDGPDRGWGVFDLDGAAVPEGLSFPRQLLAIRDKALPAEFNNVRMVATATSSTGRKAGLHARLYFLLAQPLANLILERYAETLNKAAPDLHLDGSVFRAGMPIYTARPVPRYGRPGAEVGVGVNPRRRQGNCRSRPGPLSPAEAQRLALYRRTWLGQRNLDRLVGRTPTADRS